MQVKLTRNMNQHPSHHIVDLLSFIDRVNIGNARVAGLQADLKMSDHQYSLRSDDNLYLPYIAIEIPAGLLLKRVGANILLPTMVDSLGDSLPPTRFSEAATGAC
jgi:hypothetical protein